MSFKGSLIKAYGESLSLEKGWICHYCEVPLVLTDDSSVRNQATIDHIIPQSRGGKTVIGNLALACRHCNTSKGQSSVEEWRLRQRQKLLPKLVVSESGCFYLMIDGQPIDRNDAIYIIQRLMESLID
jgi:hypothetical protein